MKPGETQVVVRSESPFSLFFVIFFVRFVPSWQKKESLIAKISFSEVKISRLNAKDNVV